MPPIKTLIYICMVLFGCYFSITRPLAGIVTYIAVYMTASNNLWWYSYLNQLHFRSALIASIALIFSFFSNDHLHRPPYLRATIYEKTMILFLIVLWASLLLGLETSDSSWILIDKMSKIIIILLIMLRIVYTYNAYVVVRWTWVLCTFYLGYRAYTAGGSDYVNGRLDGIGGVDFSGSSGFGAHMAMSLPLVGISFLQNVGTWKKTFALLTGVLTCFALVASQTRAALVGLAVGLTVAIFKAPKEIRYKLIIWVVIAITGLTLFTPSTFWSRMQTIGVESEERDKSASARLDIWKAALVMLNDHPLGVGIGNFQKYIGIYAPAQHGMASHNTFLRCVCDLGYQGLILYLLLIFLAFRTLRRIRLLSNKNIAYKELAADAYALEISLVVAYVSGSFSERLYVEAYWMILTMVACLGQSADHLTEELGGNRSGGANFSLTS